MLTKLLITCTLGGFSTTTSNKKAPAAPPVIRAAIDATRCAHSLSSERRSMPQGVRTEPPWWWAAERCTHRAATGSEGEGNLRGLAAARPGEIDVLSGLLIIIVLLVILRALSVLLLDLLALLLLLALLILVLLV